MFRKYSVYEASIEEWTSILRLAHLWQCDEVRDLVFRELDKLDVPHVERVLLTTRYDARAEWREKAIEDLAGRQESLSLDDGKQLGIELTVRVAELREQRIRERIQRGFSYSPRAPVACSWPYGYGHGGPTETIDPPHTASPIIVYPPPSPSSHSGTSTH